MFVLGQFVTFYLIIFIYSIIITKMACAEYWTLAATWPWAKQTGRCHADLGFILLVSYCAYRPSVYHANSVLSAKKQSMQGNHSSKSLSKTFNKPFSGRTRRPVWLVYSLGVIILALLGACGGGSGGSNQVDTHLAPAAQLANTCVSPAQNAGEKLGTATDEKAWVRSFVDERYLWYQDVPSLDASQYASAAAYFDVLKTPAKNSAGGDLDRFHWSLTKEEYEQYTNGISVDYGIAWSRVANSPPRSYVVYDVEPQSPAGKAGIRRGDRLMKVDGIDFMNGADVTGLNNGVFPPDSVQHALELQRGTSTLSFTLQAGQYATTPVRDAKVINDNGTKVAYLYFDSFIAKSEDALIAAFNDFKTQGAKELIIDMRYNGGGLLFISSQLAYMIAGSSASSGKTFNKLVYNDKRSKENELSKFIPYALTTDYRYDYSRPLPDLKLKRVTLLVGHGTASASEAVINGLRGIDVIVNLIGSTTYGKPYGFTPQGNCGRYYFAVEFKGENHKGFSAFDTGFAPICSVRDDLNFQLGDVAEPRLAEALQFLKSGQCTTAPVASIKAMGSPELLPYVVDPKRARAMMIPTKVYP